MNGWLWCCGPRFVVALEIRESRVVRPLPAYARKWALGRTLASLLSQYPDSVFFLEC
jgi:hypothetical protein